MKLLLHAFIMHKITFKCIVGASMVKYTEKILRYTKSIKKLVKLLEVVANYFLIWI